MTVTMKVGSRVVVPVPPGLTASSNLPAIANATIQGGSLVIQALTVGKATLSVLSATDVFFAFGITVTAS